MESCLECGRPLTDEERNFYEYRCEDCERAFIARMNAWINGSADTELDLLFNIAKEG